MTCEEGLKKKASDTGSGAIRNARVSRRRSGWNRSLLTINDNSISMSISIFPVTSRGAKSEALQKRPPRRTRCARARARSRSLQQSQSLFRRRRGGEREIVVLLFHRYIPASGSDRAATDPARRRRERERKKGRERCGEGEEEMYGGTGRARGTRIERERGNNTAINNTREKMG